MSEADTADLEEEYTGEDGGVAWGRLGAGLTGIGLTLIGYFVASVIGLVRDGITGVLGGLRSFLAALVAAPFSTGSAEIESAAQTAAGGISVLGPLAFPVAVGIALATTSLILWGVSRFV